MVLTNMSCAYPKELEESMTLWIYDVVGIPTMAHCIERDPSSLF